MIIEIVSATLTDEKGLGPLYRVEQLRDGQPWVHLISRSAVATDMELFGVDDPATVVEWHLHEALAPLAAEPSPADVLAFEAQQLNALALIARARLTSDAHRQAAEQSVTADMAATQRAADTARDRARVMKASEIDQIRDIVVVADNPGLASLRTLVADDGNAVEAARRTYQKQIINSLTG